MTYSLIVLVGFAVLSIFPAIGLTYGLIGLLWPSKLTSEKHLRLSFIIGTLTPMISLFAVILLLEVCPEVFL